MSHLIAGASSTENPWRCRVELAKRWRCGADIRLKGQGLSARAIARELGLARNTALRYLKPPEVFSPQPRP